MARPTIRLSILLLAAITSQPAALTAQRSASDATDSRIPIARNATPTTERSDVRAPSAPTRLSADERLTLVRSADLDVGGISSELRLTPRAPFDANGSISFFGQATLLPMQAAETSGYLLLKGDAEWGLKAEFRVLHPDRPVLVDFVVKAASLPGEGVTIRLAGSGISEQRSLQPGDQHVTAIIVPKTHGWYYLYLEPLNKSGLWVYAVEITVLE
jgi:hypothetical protein